MAKQTKVVDATKDPNKRVQVVELMEVVRRGVTAGNKQVTAEHVIEQDGSSVLTVRCNGLKMGEEAESTIESAELAEAIAKANLDDAQNRFDAAAADLTAMKEAAAKEADAKAKAAASEAKAAKAAATKAAKDSSSAASLAE